MKKFIKRVFGQPSSDQIHYALAFLRIGLGVLTIPHGWPKIIGGQMGWEQLGVTFMYPLGIYFLPMAWGFAGAVTEFVGGIALVLGFGTRIASVVLTIMMGIATAWHVVRGDDFMVYSFPLSLAVVFAAFVVLGSGIFSIDYYITQKKTRRKKVKTNQETHGISSTGN